jgi:hypothetical protein
VSFDPETEISAIAEISQLFIAIKLTKYHHDIPSCGRPAAVQFRSRRNCRAVCVDTAEFGPGPKNNSSFSDF